LSSEKFELFSLTNNLNLNVSVNKKKFESGFL